MGVLRTEQTAYMHKVNTDTKLQNTDNSKSKQGNPSPYLQQNTALDLRSRDCIDIEETGLKRDRLVRRPR